MRNCRIYSLYSSSGGNSFCFEIGDRRILIDAGKNARTLCRALSEIGSDISAIDAIFVTHEHCDHISALETISKSRSIPIHMTEESAKKLDGTPDSAIHKNLVRHDTEYEVDMGSFRIRSFRTPHDSLMSVGYRIDIRIGENPTSVGIATDVGYVTDEISAALEGCEAVLLESNYDEDMLLSGPYPYELKKRIRSQRGHLSNKESAEFAATLAEKGTKAFMTVHLSKENNSADIVLDEYTSAIADPAVAITVASPDCPTEMSFSNEVETYDFCENNSCGDS
ncbi:MAG: MBL fold metallo-hydrolase [Clostridia bacterium]|nr:MBL fold metallo-hydrolase [Clostridia bacterium]